MPRKSRRTKRSSKPLVSWTRVLIISVPIFAALVFFTSSPSSTNVLGESDQKRFLFNLGLLKRSSDSAKPVKNKNRVATFSLSGLCDNGRNGFKSASYSCEDGTTGVLTTEKCFNPQSAFERAAKACAKKVRAKPSAVPTLAPGL